MNLMDLFAMSRTNRKRPIDEKMRSFEEAGEGAKRDPKSTKVKSVTPRIGGGSAGQFEESPVDLAEIGRAYHSDSYIRRAIDKINGLMFKSGWGLVSSNAAALEYVEARLNLMEESTNISTEELLRELGNNFILYANAPIAKTRGSENLGGLQAAGYYGGEPINGLFPISAEYFQVQRDEFGNIEAYVVSGDSGGQGVEFKVEDVSHLTYHKPTGRAYGVPHIQNVIDDVLILRQIEENVARLVYRNLFPLQTYKVGLDKPGYEATDEEIDEVTAAIRDMPIDGILVIPERHEIKTVSSAGGALDAYSYLKYFRQRVFTGLGVSESTMGIGDSGNKSTSDNQSSDLIDLVKDFQQTFASEIQREVINEILFEGGFDPTLNKDDRVVFKFTEIEQSAKIARENHELQKFMGNVQSLDETRERMGYEPTTDLTNFFMNLTAQVAMDTASAAATIANKDQPENQAGKQLNPNKDTTKASFDKNNQNSLLTEFGLKVRFTTDESKKAEKEQEWREYWLSLKDHVLESHASAADLTQETALIQAVLERLLEKETSWTSEQRQELSASIVRDLSNQCFGIQAKEDLERKLHAFQYAFYANCRKMESKAKEGGQE